MCLVHPGAVFNMACTVASEPPLQASVSALPLASSNLLQLVSEDQATAQTFCSWDELYQDLLVSSPPALAPASSMKHECSIAVHAASVAVLLDCNLALRLGLTQTRAPQSAFPAGIRVSTLSRLPRGSGLGGSSILALACIRALAAACEFNLSHDEEMDRVLAVEQVLGTGGGWQDQIGCTPGLKFTTRLDAVYQVTRVSLSVEHRSLLENRLICLGTAITRVAKTVLVGVVDKYCYAHPSALQILAHELPLNANRMREAVERFAAEAVTDSPKLEEALACIGEELSVYRSLCQGLQGVAFLPDCLLPAFEALAQVTYGANLMGAGSGGFILGVLRDGCSRELALEAVREAVRVSGGETVTLSLEDVSLVV